MSRAIIIPLRVPRSAVIPLRAARAFVTGIIVPSSSGVTFHILTELGAVIDTELSEQTRTE